MLQIEDTLLVVVDIQGKLARVVHESQRLIESAARLISGANVLDVPIICTEQNPRGLGATVDEIAPLLGGEPIAKMTFSCCGEGRFIDALRAAGRRQVLLAGIEAHVCIYQTAMDLLDGGFGVHAVADAISSRRPANRDLAVEKMRDAGASITCVETALFELLGTAENPKFKAILDVVK